MQNAPSVNCDDPAKRTRGHAPESNNRSESADATVAYELTLHGQVQGVGFRPFVYRLAVENDIAGQVQNHVGEVVIAASGRRDRFERFCRELVDKAPPLSRVTKICRTPLDNASFTGFNILESCTQSVPKVFVPPDYYLCDDCRDELRDPTDRRFDYPFINCTQCGPRYTLIESLPYDRPNTSMVDFPMCNECLAEYSNPADRRFHAEPVACPACGPALTFVGNGAANAGPALDEAVRMLKTGKIVAVKGIGGYHLVCDAYNEVAIARLRKRKARPAKPLAVMFPVEGNDGLDAVRRSAVFDSVEARQLLSPDRPIVLLQKTTIGKLATNVAPGLAEVGAILPYSPLHQLLLDRFGGPVVATSGNISGEPVLIDNDEAERRLSDVVDGFLHHDRRIVRPADDSVYRRIDATMRPLRVGRGGAPAEFELPWQQPQATLAVGGQMKSTIALSWENRIVVSPHIGEMDSPRSLAVLERVAADLQALYKVRAERIACDAHPGYTTHRWAHRQDGMEVHDVWHHAAHASALAAEFGRPGPWLVFAWDGVGLGEDGTLWGGEALVGEPGAWQRAGSLRAFRLQGADRAGREPWRSAAALLWEIGTDWDGCPDRTGLAEAAWTHDLNSPGTTSAGRIFDAAAALIIGVHEVSYEAAGPMQLEALCRRARPPVSLPLDTGDDGICRIDWEPLLAMLIDSGVDAGIRSEILHSSLANAILMQAREIREGHEFNRIGLCGGVFQNRALTEQAAQLLRNDGFRVHLPARLPCNDGALSVGQAIEVGLRTLRGRH